jgi:DNA-binding SARP family transcriptional activator
MCRSGARLRELRATAAEDLYQARLAQGEHAALVADLEAAVAAEPLRERRWVQLMTALYRSGRQPDALRAFQRLRRLLADERVSNPAPRCGPWRQPFWLKTPG